MPEINLTNTAFGPYTLREIISAGGIAEVYRAEHNDDHKSVAVKVMRTEKQADAYHRRCFEDEYKLLQQFKHQCLPTARRFGDIKGRAAFAMDFMTGAPVHQMIKSEQKWNRAGALYDLVATVAYVHRQQVVHADLKLENVILRPTGNIALVDFGNAREQKPVGFFAKLLNPKKDRVFGTPTYFAPELLKAQQPSYSSDVYALGVCAFFMLSGEPPFDANSRTGRLNANLHAQAPSIATRCPQLSKKTASIIDRCLEKDPQERPGDASSLLEGIAELKGNG
jgi:eukaryotic-like serine/threonine-protein kinase